ncbi:MAG: Serine/threonine-protein kinase PknB [Syntrophomonadaceae bacterium]|nr:Serine/threonine-protein kinase PknB [Bacillota bacterium]
MKNYEETLRRVRQVREEVSKAIEMLNEGYTGTDLDEGRKFLEEAGGAVKRNHLDRALSLAREAQLAARPTTEYLLDRAKNLERSGSEAYQRDEFTQAIEIWQNSLEEYGRVKELALERKEDEIIKGLEPILSSIEQDIETAKRNKANVEMLSRVEEANKAADVANQKFEAGQFDIAKERFEAARDLYARGARIAQDFGFDDKSRIKEAEAEMSSSIESCLLARGEALIEAASKEEAARKEEAFSGAISHIESFSSGSKKYEELKERAYKGLARGRIEVGIQIMEETEAILNSGEYYQSKENYRRAQEHFENLRDFAVEHRLEREKSEIDNLIEDCTANIRVCTDSLLGRERVATARVRKVDDLRRGIRVKTVVERPGEDKLSKLEKAYPSIRPLDSGGFGDVFLAQTREGTTIALKVIREPERHEEIFFKELKIWQDLVHRNIVKLLQPKIHPMPLFEMEYVDGGDLKSLMEQSTPFSPERACRIAFDIARGLEYAHASNVIHADLKPRNILLTMTEEVKITDWGLGKIATSSSKSTGYTPGYAAPEQIRKEPLGKRTDVYQLGVVFYEMLTGDNPFDHGSLVEKDEKVLTLVPEKPSKYSLKAKPLDDLVLRCLEKDITDRPGIREFREVLSRYAKQNYGILLQVTGQHRDRSGILCRIAMFTAKLGDYQECLGALRDLKPLLGEHELRQIVQNLMYAMEHRQKEELGITDEVLNEIDGVLRRVEYGQS